MKITCACIYIYIYIQHLTASGTEKNSLTNAHSQSTKNKPCFLLNVMLIRYPRVFIIICALQVSFTGASSTLCRKVHRVALAISMQRQQTPNHESKVSTCPPRSHTTRLRSPTYTLYNSPNRISFQITYE